MHNSNANFCIRKFIKSQLKKTTRFNKVIVSNPTVKWRKTKKRDSDCIHLAHIYSLHDRWRNKIVVRTHTHTHSSPQLYEIALNLKSEDEEREKNIGSIKCKFILTFDEYQGLASVFFIFALFLRMVFLWFASYSCTCADTFNSWNAFVFFLFLFKTT